MLISARFTGQPAKGYVTGQQYTLQVMPGPVLTIEREDGTGRYSYVGFRSFLQDWDEIKLLGEGY